MISREKLKHRIEILEEKHKELDKRISLDMEPEYIIRVLKKEKLELRDEIEEDKRKLDGMPHE
jgi:uncharacterized protein YdcH (DUF465 family)